MPIVALKVHKDMVGGFLNTNSGVVKATEWVFELVVNLVQFEVRDTQYPNVVHPRDPLLL